MVPEATMRTALLSLVKISKKHRHQGNGKAIVKNLESYLRQNYQTDERQSGVQTNNEAGIAFWTRCSFEIGQNAKAINRGTVVYNIKKKLARVA